MQRERHCYIVRINDGFNESSAKGIEQLERDIYVAESTTCQAL